jgi:hypothetical protein
MEIDPFSEILLGIWLWWLFRTVDCRADQWDWLDDNKGRWVLIPFV